MVVLLCQARARRRLARIPLTSLRHKVVVCQLITRQCFAKKTIATQRHVNGDPVAAITVAHVVTCQSVVRWWISRQWITRKHAFPLSHPSAISLDQALGFALGRAHMNRRYKQVLAEAGENKKEPKKLPNQVNDLATQHIFLQWQEFIINESIQGNENGANHEELFVSLIRPSCHLVSGQRFSVHDPKDSQPISRTSSEGFNCGYTGCSISDFRPANLRHWIYWVFFQFMMLLRWNDRQLNWQGSVKRSHTRESSVLLMNMVFNQVLQ